MRKWICTVIKNKKGYRADLIINGKQVSDLPMDVDYITLKTAIREKTGICILKRKDMIFEKLSDFEKIATIDATQTRNDCRVTVIERMLGWNPCFE